VLPALAAHQRWRVTPANRSRNSRADVAAQFVRSGRDGQVGKFEKWRGRLAVNHAQDARATNDFQVSSLAPRVQTDLTAEPENLDSET